MEAKASFKKIVDYLTNNGLQHVDINDVFRWNKLELSGSLRNGVNLTAMLIDSIETTVSTPNSKKFHHNQGAFTILGKPNVSTSKIDSYIEQNEVLDHCQTIAFEMAARLIYDARVTALNNAELKWLYNNIEADSFHFFKVGPVFTNQLYGYRCEFTIKAKETYEPNPIKWNDL